MTAAQRIFWRLAFMAGSYGAIRVKIYVSAEDRSLE